MKPVKFKESNVTYAENQPQYQPLPVLKLEGEEGNVIACWKLNFWERLSVLFLGRIWINLMTFNKPLTPTYLSAFRHNVFSLPKDSKRWSKIINYLTKKE